MANSPLIHINELPHYGDTDTAHGIINPAGGDILQIDAKYADGEDVSVQTTAEELKERVGQGTVKSVTGVDAGMVGNTDPENPQILHDPQKLDTGAKAADTAKVDGVTPTNIGKELAGAVDAPAARSAIGAMDANKTAGDIGGVMRRSPITQLIDSNIALDIGNELLGVDANGTQHPLVMHAIYVTAAEYSGSRSGFGVPYTEAEITADQSIVDYVPQSKVIKTSDGVYLWYDSGWSPFTPLTITEKDEFGSGSDQFNGNSIARPTFDVTGLGHKFQVAELADVDNAVLATQKWKPAAADYTALPTLATGEKTQTWLCRVIANGTIAEVDVADFASLPATGAAETLYKTLDDGKLFIWDGAGYVETAPGYGTTGVYQWIGGSTAWVYFGDNADFIDETELNAAIQAEKGRAEGVEQGLTDFITRTAGFATAQQGADAEAALANTNDKKLPVVTFAETDYSAEILAKLAAIGLTATNDEIVFNTTPPASWGIPRNGYHCIVYRGGSGVLFFYITNLLTGVSYNCASYNNATAAPVWVSQDQDTVYTATQSDVFNGTLDPAIGAGALGFFMAQRHGKHVDMSFYIQVGALAFNSLSYIATGLTFKTGWKPRNLGVNNAYIGSYSTYNTSKAQKDSGIMCLMVDGVGLGFVNPQVVSVSGQYILITLSYMAA